MKITGELLKAERIKKNLTIAEVATTLKLSSKIITALEAGDIDELPAKTFIRGFVKSYASLLKLDVDLILRQFQEEMGSTQPLPKNPPPMPVSEEKSAPKAKSGLTQNTTTTLDLDKDARKKTILYVSVACGLLGVILLINNTIEKYQKEAVVDANKIEKIQPINPPAAKETAPMSTAATTSTPTAAVPAVVATATTTAPIAPIETAPASTATAKTETKPLIESASPAATPAVAETTTSNGSPEDFEPSPGKPVELIVEAKKEVEFFYAKGNTKNFVRVKLSPKQLQVIRSSSGLHLKAEDGSLFTLILNGVEKGSASSSNKPVRLTF